jgi:prepilin-type N-terminal cleavage/methylation domain-containing protein
MFVHLSMRASFHSSIPGGCLRGPGSRGRRGATRPAGWRAFSLIELMIAVAIIGNLALIATPAFVRAVVQVRGNALLNDFRVFASAFTQYGHVNGSYPPTDTSGAVVARTMSGFITASQWTRETPIGGGYAFLKDTYVGNQLYRALIRVSATTAGTASTLSAAGSADTRSSRTTTTSAIKFTEAQLRRVDVLGDDGNLAAGQFFTSGAALTTYYVVER